MFEKILSFIAPPGVGASPRKVFYWRLMISGFVLLLIVHISHISGFIPGFDGVAFAEDVDLKIERALEPINSDLKTIKNAQSKQSSYLVLLVKSDLSRLIDRELRARCSATTRDEKDRIKSAIESYQNDYEEVAGDEYTEPKCDEL